MKNPALLCQPLIIVVPAPIIISELKSSLLIHPGDSLTLKKKQKLIINLESESKIEKNRLIGYYKVKNERNELINGKNIWDIFSDYDNVKVNPDKIFYSWNHRPLISGSVKYKGSYFNHKARIYTIDLMNNTEPILIKNITKDCFIRIWI